MFSEETLYSIALRKCPLVGDVIFRKLVSEIGSAKEVWEISKGGLQNIQGIGKKISAEIGKPEYLSFAENELKFCEKNNIGIKLRHLDELPKLLSECDDAPAILYQKGTIDAQKKPVSIVGTRNITNYGRQFILDFIASISTQNAVTVSGLALGADTDVHTESINNKIPTIGVLAHGFHTLYPAKNRQLSEKILEENGALITEFNSSQKPDRENFIQRNRIVAGLSPATIIVETAFGGGSVSTATFANGYNREVFALPGKITDKYSQGCNQLIFNNKAAAISTIKDLADALGFGNSEKNGELFPKSMVRPTLEGLQKDIFSTVQSFPNISLDEISEKTGVAGYKILPVLLDLEISGYIKALSGRQYITL